MRTSMMDRATELPASPPAAADPLHPPRSYLPWMFVLLTSATIFEGYDITIFHLCTPDIMHTFAMNDSTIGLIATIVRLGGLLSFFLVASADLHGRKPIVVLSVFFYAIFTLMTAISRGMITFAIFQTIAQLFLAAEFGVAVTMISEEFPDAERGRAIAGLLTVAFLGVAAAGGLYGFIAPSKWGWRGMYFIGIAPLVITIFLRRGLRETMRFRVLVAARTLAGIERGSLWPKIRESLREVAGPYRSRLIVVALLWNSIGFIGGPTITFFSLFARREHNWSAEQVGVAVILAYLMGSVGSLIAGWAIDRIGRRLTTAFFYICSGLAMAMLFQSASFRNLMLALIATMFSYQAARTAASALSTELFPTEIRACGYSLT
ncbi:MAG: MFS transporter, partial [Pseudomonadota bacterium]